MNVTSLFLGAALWLVIGIATGLVYFRLLASAAASLAARRRVAPILALAALRLGLALTVFGTAALMSAQALLATFAGFLVARAVVRRRVEAGV